MKYSESWLRDWVKPKDNRKKLSHRLTMSGFEVEEVLEAKALGSTESGYVFDINVTPNRGDCLSVRGISREIAAITHTKLTPVKIKTVSAACRDTLPIRIQAKNECPRYVGRIIRQVKADLQTPMWLRNRLLASGLNLISPIVDVTNYVMLELGQPMHAFNLQAIKGGINVRLSKKGESIKLLDGSEIHLDTKTLVIADNKTPLAIAGIMGGIDSCVTLNTTDILLESAYFSPQSIARQRQQYLLNSDSSYRFERGVDPTLQREAIERATALILTICGGEAGPVMEASSKPHLPTETKVTLTDDLIEKVLGICIAPKQIESIFKSLQFKYKRSKQGWQVVAPSYRYDIKLPEDLIEEIARLYGYDKIPTQPIMAVLGVSQPEAAAPNTDWLRELLSNTGYHEVITYSFVDKMLQVLLEPHIKPIEIMNPITAEMSVMRTNLLPGLLTTLRYNVSRQQARVRLFEMGVCFDKASGKLVQTNRLAGLLTGSALSEQWGATQREVDFFDLKGDLENLLRKIGVFEHCTFKPITHPALHPGQSAEIGLGKNSIGVMGALHPSIVQTLDLPHKVYVFEIAVNPLLSGGKRLFNEISKFPEIRRDIAILVKQTIPSDQIQATIRNAAGGWLKDVFIFDVYQGKGIPAGCKSLALAMVLQHPTRTLIDEEAIAVTERVVTALKGQYGAELRS